MTDSTDKGNLFQIFAGLFFLSRRSSHQIIEAEQDNSFTIREREVSLGNLTEEEVASFLRRWQKLLGTPESFPCDAKTPIHEIVNQERGLMVEKEMIGSILSAHLQEDDEITEAIESSTKIFHEDYPGSYILAYNGKRLGMFRLSICKNDQGTYMMSYKFHQQMTSFKELY